MLRNPHPLKTRRTHGIKRIVVDPRLRDCVDHRVVEKCPRRIGDNDFFCLIVKLVTNFEVNLVGGTIDQLLELRVVVEGVVVSAPLVARKQYAEEILRVRKIGLPGGQERGDCGGDSSG